MFECLLIVMPCDSFNACLIITTTKGAHTPMRMKKLKEGYPRVPSDPPVDIGIVGFTDVIVTGRNIFLIPREWVVLVTIIDVKCRASKQAN